MIILFLGDFVAGTYRVPFSPGANTASLEIGITNDDDIESTEEFTVSIDQSHPSLIPGGVLIGDPSQSFVEILDDDSKQIWNFRTYLCFLDAISTHQIYVQPKICTMYSEHVTMN